ncbi:MAG: 16S rRNA (cytidine(1402)-2'-O)-methyltransferase [Hyphomicrobiales bacterium]
MQHSNAYLLEGQRVPAPPLAPGLYVTATPIGNLADITIRALQTLAAADLILCEDTRVSRKLVQKYGIDAPLKPYHDHNAERVRPEIVSRLEDGAAVVLISDAGTPLVSDPGFKLVREVAAAGLPVIAIPGPSAALTGLAVAGLPSDRFLFAGFPPAKQGQRSRFFREFATCQATLIFFVSAQKLGVILAELAEVLGGRDAVVARELTKLHEEVLRGDLASLARQIADRSSLKGEVTLLVAGPGRGAVVDQGALDELLSAALEQESVRDAARSVAEQLGLRRQQVYLRALELSKAGQRDG